MSLNGIDIASYQSALVPSKVAGDFIIVKATQGTTYTNPAFKKHADATIACGKLLGVYHYANGKTTAEKEAEYFVSVAKDYIGKAILVLDWETSDKPEAKNYQFDNKKYAKDFLDAVAKKTGIVPFIYMSEYVAKQAGWAEVSKTYPLWVASYGKNALFYGYKNDIKAPTGLAAWKCLIFQYGSQGRISGYNANLDVDIAYMTKDDWKKYAGVKVVEEIKPVVNTTIKGKISVDGDWGKNTTKKAQTVFGTTVDGVVSNQPEDNKKYLTAVSSFEFKQSGYTQGSDLIKAIQKMLKEKKLYDGKIDGWCGKKTIIGLQRMMKIGANGKCNERTVKYFQRWLNKQ